MIRRAILENRTAVLNFLLFSRKKKKIFQRKIQLSSVSL